MFRSVLLKFNKLQSFKYSTAIPEPIRDPKVHYNGIFINNEWHKSRSGKTFKTFNPATGEVIAEVQHGTKEDIDLAVNAANDAFKFGSQWRTIDASERGRLLFKLAALIERDSTYLASLESTDNGMPYTLACGFLDIGLRSLRYMAGWADKNCGKTIPVDGPYLCYTRHEPVGVCGQIIPWNGPLVMMLWKIAAALSMGNTVVLKPAEQTPLTALYTAELCKEAGIPPGVVNVVPGFGDAGEALVANRKVDKIAFTGSTEVGLKIQQGAGAHNLKRVSLELGGKSPNIILADANLEEAVETAHLGLFLNQGQVCCAGSRIFVEDAIYDDFVERSVVRARRRVVGDPLDRRTEQGPQIDNTQMEKILRLVDCSTKEGATVLAGGQRLGEKGYYVEPTVIVDVEDHHTVARDEIFGPVQTIMKFKNLEEVIERANNTNYGLASGIISNDIDKINYLTQGIRAGTVWVNCYNVLSPQQPFGGYKDSGIGREMGEYGLNQYTEVKNVTIRLPQKNS